MSLNITRVGRFWYLKICGWTCWRNMYACMNYHSANPSYKQDMSQLYTMCWCQVITLSFIFSLTIVFTARVLSGCAHISLIILISVICILKITLNCISYFKEWVLSILNNRIINVWHTYMSLYLLPFLSCIFYNFHCRYSTHPWSNLFQSILHLTKLQMEFSWFLFHLTVTMLGHHWFNYVVSFP
jgi:hypothetical protein